MASTTSCTLHITLTINPTSEAVLLESITSLLFKMLKEDPRCVYFNVFKSEFEVGRFRVVEIWNMDHESVTKVSKT
jgi:quinol monooxygenase YgiN